MSKKIVMLLVGLFSGLSYFVYTIQSSPPSFLGEWMAIEENESLQLIEFTKNQRLIHTTCDQQRELTYSTGKKGKDNRALYYYIMIEAEEYYLIYPEADNLNYAYLMEYSTPSTKPNVRNGKIVCELIRP